MYSLCWQFKQSNVSSKNKSQNVNCFPDMPTGLLSAWTVWGSAHFIAINKTVQSVILPSTIQIQNLYLSQGGRDSPPLSDRHLQTSFRTLIPLTWWLLEGLASGLERRDDGRKKNRTMARRPHIMARNIMLSEPVSRAGIVGPGTVGESGKKRVSGGGVGRILFPKVLMGCEVYFWTKCSF